MCYLYIVFTCCYIVTVSKCSCEMEERVGPSFSFLPQTRLGDTSERCEWRPGSRTLPLTLWKLHLTALRLRFCRQPSSKCSGCRGKECPLDRMPVTHTSGGSGPVTWGGCEDRAGRQELAFVRQAREETGCVWRGGSGRPAFLSRLGGRKVQRGLKTFTRPQNPGSPSVDQCSCWLRKDGPGPTEPEK